MADERLEQPLEVLAVALDSVHTLTGAGAALVAHALSNLPVDAAVLTLRGAAPAAHRTLAAAGPLVGDLDEIQAELGRGPGLDDLSCGATVTLDDTRAETAWPEWSASVARHGVRWVHLVGLLPLGDEVARLELYAHRPRALSTEDLARANELASGAGLALRLAHRVVHLEDAMQTRDLIGQGQGIIMERYGLDAEQAMGFLRRRSQESQVKLRNLAQRLVASAHGTASSTAEPSLGPE